MIQEKCECNKLCSDLEFEKQIAEKVLDELAKHGLQNRKPYVYLVPMDVILIVKLFEQFKKEAQVVKSSEITTRQFVGDQNSQKIGEAAIERCPSDIYD